MERPDIGIFSYFKDEYPIPQAFYYSYLFEQYIIYPFWTFTIALPNSIYLVYNISNNSPYLDIETTLTGPSVYTVVTSSTVTTVNSYNVTPGTYTISISIYNPSGVNYVYQLGNVTITPNPANSGSTITVSAQVLNAPVTVAFVFGWDNEVDANVTVYMNYQYFFYDLTGSLVYSSPTYSTAFFTLAYSNLGATVTVIYAPAGVSTISISATITGTSPPYLTSPSSFSSVAVATSTSSTLEFYTFIT